MELCAQILSDITVFTKYSRFIPELGRRETWYGLVTRNMNMHLKKFPELATEITKVYQLVFDRKVMPSMRSMQFAGLPIEIANNRMFNCAFLPLDDMNAFSELMLLLLGGSGVGYSVQHRDIKNLPKILGPTAEKRRFLVADSIEGWADAIKVILESYAYGKHKVVLDYMAIREKGAVLVTSGGKAPGPEPLKECIKKLCKVLDRRTGKHLRSVDAHDMACIIADAVLAGGIRRAALLCLFDRDDDLMFNCKTTFNITLHSAKGTLEGINTYYVETEDGEHHKISVKQTDHFTINKILNGKVDWFDLYPYRGRANNSVVLPRGKVKYDEFSKIMVRVRASNCGEPGVYWTSDPKMGTNPCGEVALQPFQFCNVCDINVSNITSQADLNERATAAAFIGTLQAAYTNFHYLRPIWKTTTEKEGLLGVGMTGIGSGEVLKYNLRIAAEKVVEENARVAKLLGINPAARSTTIKPAGTTSMVCGTASGVHAYHNDHYIRRVRMGKDEALAKYLLKNIPELIEQDVFVKNGLVASFPQKAPKGAILRHESASQLLERVRLFNLEWVRHGHSYGANTHNVSCTISVKDHEWGEVTDWMWNNRNDYNGIAVLPYNGGTYVQAPFEDITEEKYYELEKHLTDIDLKNVREDEDNTDLQGEIACGGGQCELQM